MQHSSQNMPLELSFGSKRSFLYVREHSKDDPVLEKEECQ